MKRHSQRLFSDHAVVALIARILQHCRSRAHGETQGDTGATVLGTSTPDQITMSKFILK